MVSIQAASDFPVRPQTLLDSLELNNGHEILSLGARLAPGLQLEFQQANIDWNVADPYIQMEITASLSIGQITQKSFNCN